jgi:hypothetical protein
MTTKRLLRGYELRCVLTLHLFQNGKTTVADLIDMLDYHGFEVTGRPSKAVPDRIHQRALALREEAAALWYPSDDAFWDALFGLELGEDRR